MTEQEALKTLFPNPTSPERSSFDKDYVETAEETERQTALWEAMAASQQN